MAVGVKTAGEDIPDVGSGIEMLSSWRPAKVLDLMNPPTPWFHLLLVLLPLTLHPTTRQLRKTAMRVAVKLEDVAFSEEIAGQARIAVMGQQGRPRYGVMSVTLNSYPYIKSGKDIGVSETMQRWAWSEYSHICLSIVEPSRRFSSLCTYIAFLWNIRKIIDEIVDLQRVLPHTTSQSRNW